MNKVKVELNKAFHKTNKRIKNKENSFFAPKTSGDGFNLKTEKYKKKDDGLANYFPNSPVTIVDIIATVNPYLRIEQYVPHATRGNHSVASLEALTACLVAQGCNLGIASAMLNAKGVNQGDVENVWINRFSKDNLQDILEAQTRLIDSLHLPTLFKGNPNLTHTSSDGQKMGVAVDSINSGKSFKFFGKGKGANRYNFITDTFTSFAVRVFHPGTREAVHLLGGLRDNKAVKSDMHSTDTHGYTDLNFALTYFFDILLAPRIKQLDKLRLFGFESIKDYQDKDYIVIHDNYVNERLIKDNWEEILRFLCTVALEQTDPAQLIERLKAYPKRPELYKAFVAFGRAIKSIFILKYIDEKEFRDLIGKQLNRSEADNNFHNAVFYSRNRDFQEETREDQERIAICTTILKNFILIWNFYHLSQTLVDANSEEKTNLVNHIQNGSAVVWHHVCMTGEFNYKAEVKELIKFDMSKINALDYDLESTYENLG